jgi:hypothetical protein
MKPKVGADTLLGGRRSRGVRGVRRSRRGGWVVEGGMASSVFGGGKRPFIKRTCRSKSRCGGAALVALRPYTRGGYYGFH